MIQKNILNNTENHRKNSKNGLYLKVDSYNNLNMYGVIYLIY